MTSEKPLSSKGIGEDIIALKKDVVYYKKDVAEKTNKVKERLKEFLFIYIKDGFEEKVYGKIDEIWKEEIGSFE